MPTLHATAETAWVPTEVPERSPRTVFEEVAEIATAGGLRVELSDGALDVIE
jgi:hypothetical protein